MKEVDTFLIPCQTVTNFEITEDFHWSHEQGKDNGCVDYDFTLFWKY